MSDTLGKTLGWFQQVRPNPDNLALHTQFGVHFEEVGEMLEALDSPDPAVQRMIQAGVANMKELARALKGASNLVVVRNEHELLDALCDQIVTAVGVAHMCDFGIVGAMHEVNRSNFSKFVDGAPVFDEQGKVRKGPGYVPASLDAYV